MTKKELEHFNFYVGWRKLSKEEASELKSYLQHETLGDFYKEVFKELTIDETKTIAYQPDALWAFQPLELFRLLDIEKDFVISNKDNPLLVVGHLKRVETEDKFKQRYFLETLVQFLRFLGIYNSNDFIICRNYIESLIEACYEAFYWERENQKRDKWASPSFYITELFLEKLPNTQLKINHLREVFIECEAFHLSEEQNGGKSDESENEKFARKEFLRQCEIQIQRYEKLLELEKENSQPTIASEIPSEEITRKHKGKFLETHKDFSQDRAILLMKSLAPRLKGCDQNKVAEVIAFLTGFSIEGVRIGLSEIKNKFMNKPVAYNKDVKIVCDYLNLIGLTDEAERLKKDSGVT
jgi:hypothetical protein